MTQNSTLPALIAAAALASLVTRFFIDLPDYSGDPLATIWAMARYFTILTNAAVAGMMVWILARRPVSPGWAAGLTLSIAIVGVVYHLLLSASTNYEGIEIWVDHGLHTVVPGLTALWWVVSAPKSPLGPLSPLSWLIWPGVYCVYAVGRGLLDGTYPYFFVNLDELGVAGLARSVTELLIAFAIAGYAQWGVAKLLTRGPSVQARDGSSSM